MRRRPGARGGLDLRPAWLWRACCSHPERSFPSGPPCRRAQVHTLFDLVLGRAAARAHRARPPLTPGWPRPCLVRVISDEHEPRSVRGPFPRASCPAVARRDSGSGRKSRRPRPAVGSLTGDLGGLGRYGGPGQAPAPRKTGSRRRPANSSEGAGIEGPAGGGRQGREPRPALRVPGSADRLTGRRRPTHSAPSTWRNEQPRARPHTRLNGASRLGPSSATVDGPGPPFPCPSL